MITVPEGIQGEAGRNTRLEYKLFGLFHRVPTSLKEVEVDVFNLPLPVSQIRNPLAQRLAGWTRTSFLIKREALQRWRTRTVGEFSVYAKKQYGIAVGIQIV
ncbi:hypothetical protein M514_27755 [Trichuris suis]|uniref:Uncharacterized protein n=1 Tax=Trichuris suis TaxID=68888 RepID=A0A085MS63_9BILA|nr:hypothetical protein M514_27755 [Trichuris suis]